MSPNSLANLQAVCKLNQELRTAGKKSDDEFLAALLAKTTFTQSRGLTPEILYAGIADEVLITVQITKDGEKPEEFTYPALVILAYHQDDRSWLEVGQDPSAAHAQTAYAETFAFWYEKGRFGESAEDYEVNLK